MTPVTLRQRSLRISLLFLILLSFVRLLYHLDYNTLWWDESLSLMRAEQNWLPLVRGDMRFSTGIVAAFTPDQHPFLYFAILKLFMAIAGKSEFTLRFFSVICSVLIIPVSWALGRFIQRRFSQDAPISLIAAILAAVHPFYLWYGQEVRHYSLWVLLTLVATYELLCWLEVGSLLNLSRYRRWAQVRYWLVMIMLLLTHYYSVLILPVHFIAIFLGFRRVNFRRTLRIVTALFIASGAAFSVLLFRMLAIGGATQNNTLITPRMLLPDLLNSYSLGPTSDVVKLSWILAIFAGLALLGTVRLVQNRGQLEKGGWIIPLSVAVPPIVLLLAALVIAPYQTSRHLALISGLFVLLVAVGLAFVWQRWSRVFAVTLLLIMLGGMVYSTNIYYNKPQARYSDLRSVGDTLHKYMLPGDLLLLYPPEYFRSFQYYPPLDEIAQAPKTGLQAAWEVVPIGITAEDPSRPLASWMSEETQKYKRIWFMDGGTILLNDPNAQSLTWLQEHLILTNHFDYNSEASDLDLYLFYPSAPVITTTTFVPDNSLEVVVGEDDPEIALRGYKFGTPINSNFSYPVTLYWRALRKPQVRYRYILDLIQINADGSHTLLAKTEREPFDGGIPTIWWDPGQFIMEPSEIGTGLPTLDKRNSYQLHIQIYRNDTLEKQTLKIVSGDLIQVDPVTVAIPFFHKLRAQ